jgi:glyoxalase family protein
MSGSSAVAGRLRAEDSRRADAQIQGARLATVLMTSTVYLGGGEVAGYGLDDRKGKTMDQNIPGLHHVTAICGAPRANVEFYRDMLGQHLIKKTVNFDDPGTYHLYYGDAAGNPGTILTFFPFVNAGPGRAGPGMASAFAYSLGSAEFAEAEARLGALAPNPDAQEARFGARVSSLRDPDGATVELVESEGPADGHGFHSVTLWLRDPDPTARLLMDVFGYVAMGQERQGAVTRLRLQAPGAARGNIVDLIRHDAPIQGRSGAGTIHHVAFRATTQEAQHAWQDRLASAGHRTTDVINRQYFNAIYFREPGGVLFEIATDPPGFTVDEPADALGQRLMLPPQYEPMRARIEAALPPLTA